MYMDQSNPASNPLPIQQMRTLIKSSDHNINNNNHNSNSRGAHPNGGHSRSSSDPYLFRSNDDIDNCKHQLYGNLPNLLFSVYWYEMHIVKYMETTRRLHHSPAACIVASKFSFANHPPKKYSFRSHGNSATMHTNSHNRFSLSFTLNLLSIVSVTFLVDYDSDYGPWKYRIPCSVIPHSRHSQPQKSTHPPTTHCIRKPCESQHTENNWVN